MVRRLARCQRPEAPKNVPLTDRSSKIHGEDAIETGPKPKHTPATSTLGQAIAEYAATQRQNPNTAAALKSLQGRAGHRTPQELRAEDVAQAQNAWSEFSQNTRSTYGKCLRRFLIWLERMGAAPATISDAVRRVPQPGPRLTIATPVERRKILNAAQPHFRFFLLLCADLGLRHRTASSLTPRAYDPKAKTLTFRTKGNEQQTLPVSAEVGAILDRARLATLETLDPDTPIVNQLRHGHRPGTQPGPRPRFSKMWKKLKQKLGIRPDLRIHDLRRTCAEEVWEATKNLRVVQAQLGHRSISTTARYLANRVGVDELRAVQNIVARNRKRSTRPTRKP